MGHIEELWNEWKIMLFFRNVKFGQVYKNGLYITVVTLNNHMDQLTISSFAATIADFILYF